MKYCKKCYILCDDSSCPRCGNPYVRPVEADDYVFLAERKYPWSEMLEGALADEGIPVITYGVWKAKIVIGSMHERHNIFVPYAYLERASELMTQLFDETNLAEDFEWEKEV